ncbi:hypothetical protein BDN72DRAFT_894225 [Pluteus cervinus]|uniref:Uncharacterized protein n=1 Tax=Pluteus cervinus TaxID=181527 RepID=A0ACD3B4D2_9AGAR|nr:hypothetical protein BDN72DRAFT_894225 [Pluteus cervinus]
MASGPTELHFPPTLPYPVKVVSIDAPNGAAIDGGTRTALSDVVRRLNQLQLPPLTALPTFLLKIILSIVNTEIPTSVCVRPVAVVPAVVMGVVVDTVPTEPVDTEEATDSPGDDPPRIEKREREACGPLSTDSLLHI